MSFGFESTGTVKKCGKCERKIFVERVLIGVDHTANMAANCWDCLPRENKEKAFEMYSIGPDGEYVDEEEE